MNILVFDMLSYLIIFAPIIFILIGGILLWKFKKYKKIGKIILMAGFVLLIIYILGSIWFYNNLTVHNDCD